MVNNKNKKEKLRIVGAWVSQGRNVSLYFLNNRKDRLLIYQSGLNVKYRIIYGKI